MQRQNQMTLPQWIFPLRGRIRLFSPNDDPEAQRLRTAFLAEDWQIIEVALDSVIGDDFQWMSRRLTDFQDRPAGYDRWCAAATDSFYARLLRGTHGIQWAWEARGDGYASEITANNKTLFVDRLREAEADLIRAAELRPQHSAPLVELITIGMALHDAKQTPNERFQQVVKFDPWNYEAHVRLLTATNEKWGGSHDAMFSFARERFAAAPDGALIGALIPDAHLEFFARESAEEDYWAQPEVRDEIREAFTRSIGHSDHVPGRCTHFLRNLFGFCFYHTDDRDMGRLVCRQIGNRPTQYPWEMWGNDVPNEYRDFRRWANGWVFA